MQTDVLLLTYCFGQCNTFHQHCPQAIYIISIHQKHLGDINVYVLEAGHFVYLLQQCYFSLEDDTIMMSIKALL